jgi:hypothetical protein
VRVEALVAEIGDELCGGVEVRIIQAVVSRRVWWGAVDRLQVLK